MYPPQAGTNCKVGNVLGDEVETPVNVLRTGVQGNAVQILYHRGESFLNSEDFWVLTLGDFHYKAAVNILLWIGLKKKN